MSKESVEVRRLDEARNVAEAATEAFGYDVADPGTDGLERALREGGHSTPPCSCDASAPKWGSHRGADGWLRCVRCGGRQGHKPGAFGLINNSMPNFVRSMLRASGYVAPATTGTNLDVRA